jgi:hypothetical protein
MMVKYFTCLFDADYGDLVGGANATVVGSAISLQTGKAGKAYAGATDSYLTYPLSDLETRR